jgi:hypothetical protein
MGDLVKIYFVVSTRNHRSGQINYSLGDNLSQMPRGARSVHGTGHYDRGVVLSRLRKCRAGEWFPEQARSRRKRNRELDRQLVKQRKAAHARYLASLKR